MNNAKDNDAHFIYEYQMDNGIILEPTMFRVPKICI